MKLLITRPLPTPVIARAQTLFEVTERASTEPMRTDEMRAALRDFDLILPTLRDAFTAEIFASAGQIRTRLLANFGVGFNHIDVQAARAHGVAVSNTPGAVTDATADIAMTLLLMAARRAGEGERLVRSGGWTGWHPTQMLGQHVSGKVLGVVGMGRIGQAIARRCHFGFGMEVVFVNRSHRALDFPARQVDGIEALCRVADFVVAAVPGGAGTEHLIGASAFRAMKPTAVFVNISRGEVVDETALIAALQTGEIAAAGLDVYEFEPEVPEALRALENAVLLPHLGTATEEVRIGMGMLALDNLEAFAVGRALLNPV
ncbi:MAG: D-glycerate dehydrogenase [Rhodobacterales bacterium]|nr:MAG: D-glycerate dehydrogenase [Rhodobacterales bacterium]